jgi:hypothetical protein
MHLVAPPQRRQVARQPASSTPMSWVTCRIASSTTASLTEWINTHIDNLTGVQPVTLARYRSYAARCQGRPLPRTRVEDTVFLTTTTGTTTDLRWVHRKREYAMDMVGDR